MSKKKLIALALSVIVLSSAFALPVSANIIEDIYNTITDIPNAIESVFDSIEDIKDIFVNPVKYLKEKLNESLGDLLGNVALLPIVSGGSNYVSTDLNTTIKAIYTFLYPFGIGIMLVCWVFSCVKSGLTSSLDFSDKHSIVRAFVSLIIGIFAMAEAPKILTVFSSAAFSICSGLYNNITVSLNNASTKILSGPENAIGYIIFLFIIQFVLELNILYMALLQAISPLFVGFLGGSSTRKIALNFVKEYAKCILIPILTLAYAMLMLVMMNNSPWLLISGLVLGISACGIAGKKLDRLIS